MRSAIRSLYLGCMLWCCLSVSAAEARQGASREVKRLLYVTSYNASYKWTNDVITGFREYFQHVNYPVKIDVIELDVLRTPDLLPSGISAPQSAVSRPAITIWSSPQTTARWN